MLSRMFIIIFFFIHCLPRKLECLIYIYFFIDNNFYEKFNKINFFQVQLYDCLLIQKYLIKLLIFNNIKKKLDQQLLEFLNIYLKKVISLNFV